MNDEERLKRLIEVGAKLRSRLLAIGEAQEDCEEWDRLVGEARDAHAEATTPQGHEEFGA